jgi:GNAT superfamily N-acetyltransferase
MEELTTSREAGTPVKPKKRTLAKFVHAVGFLLPPWLFRYNQYIGYVSPTKPSPPGVKPNALVYRATMADAEQITKINRMPREHIQGLFDQGLVCFLAHLPGKEPASVVWAVTGRCYITGPGLGYDFGADGVYHFAGETLPEYRHVGLHSAIMSALEEHERSLNIKRRYRLIELENDKMHEHSLRIGCTWFLTVHYFSIFKVKILALHEAGRGRSLRIQFRDPQGDFVRI